MPIVREGDPKQPPLQVSKWLRIQMLLSVDELKALFDTLQAEAPFTLHRVGAVVPRAELAVPVESYLSQYAEYIDLLQKGASIDHKVWNRDFAVALTADPDAVFFVPVGDDRAVVRTCRPVVQLQHHTFQRSADDGQFRSTVLGADTISWGVELAYPQVVMDPSTRQLTQWNGDERTPNGELFRVAQRWQRRATMPTPFVVDDAVVSVPIRIGKGSLEWVNRHPELPKAGLKVDIS